MSEIPKLAFALVRACVQLLDATLARLAEPKPKPTVDEVLKEHEESNKSQLQIEEERLMQANAQFTGLHFEDLMYSRPRSNIMSKSDWVYYQATGKIDKLIRRILDDPNKD